jgi:hypothetical protein
MSRRLENENLRAQPDVSDDIPVDSSGDSSEEGEPGLENGGLDYAPLERMNRSRSCRGMTNHSQETTTDQEGVKSARRSTWRGGPHAQHSRDGLRRLSSTRVRLYTNAQLRGCSFGTFDHRQEEHAHNEREPLQAQWMEDITAVDSTTTPQEGQADIGVIRTSPPNPPRPRGRPASTTRGKRSAKMGTGPTQTLKQPSQLMTLDSV